MTGKETNRSDRSSFQESPDEATADSLKEPKMIKDTDGLMKELIYVQELLKKTEEVNENTLLAELKISIRLFE